MVRVADLHGNSDYGIVFHDSAIVEVFVQVGIFAQYSKESRNVWRIRSKIYENFKTR